MSHTTGQGGGHHPILRLLRMRRACQLPLAQAAPGRCQVGDAVDHRVSAQQAAGRAPPQAAGRVSRAGLQPTLTVATARCHALLPLPLQHQTPVGELGQPAAPVLDTAGLTREVVPASAAVLSATPMNRLRPPVRAALIRAAFGPPAHSRPPCLKSQEPCVSADRTRRTAPADGQAGGHRAGHAVPVCAAAHGHRQSQPGLDRHWRALTVVPLAQPLHHAGHHGVHAGADGECLRTAHAPSAGLTNGLAPGAGTGAHLGRAQPLQSTGLPPVRAVVPQDSGRCTRRGREQAARRRGRQQAAPLGTGAPNPKTKPRAPPLMDAPMEPKVQGMGNSEGPSAACASSCSRSESSSSPWPGSRAGRPLARRLCSASSACGSGRQLVAGAGVLRAAPLALRCAL